VDLWSAVLALAPSHPGALQWLRVVEFELLFFAGFWFVFGILDELAVDAIWLYHRLRGRIPTYRLASDVASRPLQGTAAVLVPAWQEAGVIGATIAHMLRSWPHAHLRLYVGVYANDAETLGAAMAACKADTRVRLVIHDCHGPTTKADCLNRLYRALEADELRTGVKARSVILHDAEDMVHPASLSLLDAALSDADFVQIPVRPEPQIASRWIGGHYLDEFAESHAKAMVVRDALGAAMPAAGVGCAFARPTLQQLARLRESEGGAGPFEAECLTEDYELGLLIARLGGRSRFLRLRDQHGALIATRSFFPASLPAAVRQKTRWLHGIAFQGWERLGWWGRPVDLWMELRDRRGPLVALVTFVAYLLLIISPLLTVAQHFGLVGPRPDSPLLHGIIAFCLFGLVWRALVRAAFTTREYGLGEGIRALLRIPVANVIAIMAGRRAGMAYLRSLLGEVPAWDKTAHHAHPAQDILAGDKPKRVRA
jgi:adsorption protein B